MTIHNIYIYLSAGILVIAGWVGYAVTFPANSLADQSRCRDTVLIKAINTTRQAFGQPTGQELDRRALLQYASSPLGEPAQFSCADK